MLLQGYCSTQLFYFSAHETTSAIKYNKTFILLQYCGVCLPRCLYCIDVTMWPWYLILSNIIRYYTSILSDLQTTTDDNSLQRYAASVVGGASHVTRPEHHNIYFILLHNFIAAFILFYCTWNRNFIDLFLLYFFKTTFH